MIKRSKSQTMSSQALTIRAALLARGYTMSSVARALKVTPSAVQYVVSGHSSSRKIERRICQIVGRPREALFSARGKGVVPPRKFQALAPVVNG